MSQDSSADSNDPNAVLAAVIDELGDVMRERDLKLDEREPAASDFAVALAALIHKFYDDRLGEEEEEQSSGSQSSECACEEGSLFGVLDRVLFEHHLEFKHDECDPDECGAELDALCERYFVACDDESDPDYDPDEGLPTPERYEVLSTTEEADESASSSQQCERKRTRE